MHNTFNRIIFNLLCICAIPLDCAAQDSREAGAGISQNSGIFPLPTLKINLPKGPSFEFCIAPLQTGGSPFATREIWLGGRGSGGFKEPPTRCMLAGSVVMQIGDKADWCIVIGKTEVTAAQWYGVLGTPTPEGFDGNLPITKVSRAEVATFIEKANEQMRSAQIQNISESPFKANFSDAFLRLPTESEWEFCARGGIAVDPTTFDRPTPYDGIINQYEWFFGQDSSKGKLKQVALLKPNPLGIFDMLGNASEMMETLYQVEYSQGRLGGSVIRGGDFRTEQSDLRSSMRFETPRAFPDGAAYRSGSVGIRLAIGTLVVSSMAVSERLEDEWAQHSKTRTQPSVTLPAETSVSSVTAKELEEISSLTKSLAQRFEIGDSKEMSAKQVLELMEVRTASIRGNMKRADARFAKGAVALASIISMDAVTNSAKILQSEDVLADPDIPEKSKKIASDRIRDVLEPNLRMAGSNMEDCLKMVSEIPKETVGDAFDAHIIKIEESKRDTEDPLRKSDRDRQIAATKVAKEVALDYIVNRRIGSDVWEKGVKAIARGWLEEIEKREIEQ